MTVSPAVMSPDDLAQRLVQARRELEFAGGHLISEMVERPGIEQRAARLHRLQVVSNEPQLTRVAGPRGWLVFNVKRAVRKLTRWYVEPRWTTEQQYDAELSGFATDVSAQVAGLENRVAQLEEWNSRLLREVRLLEMSVRAEQGR